LDSSRIRLRWDTVPGAERYRVYRGFQINSLSLYDSCQTTSFTDSVSLREVTYYYTITAIDTDFSVRESNFANPDSARASLPPRLTGVEFSNERQLILYFNEAIQKSPEQNPLVTLLKSGLTATSVQIMPTKQKLLCTFDAPLNGKKDTLQIVSIFDLDGIPVDIRYNRLSVQFRAQRESPYIKEVKLVNRYFVTIKFSTSMERSTVTNPDNYLVSPSGFVQEVSVDDSLCKKVQLKLSSTTMAGALGTATYLRTKNLVSQSGESLQPDQPWNLFAEPGDIDQILVYPQPVTPRHSELIFANVPENTEISVFDLNGRRIWRSKQTPKFGGIHWDLHGQNGKRVPSGIYFYRIIHENKHKTGKLVLVR
jgi:hypothetical protein